MRSQVGDVVLAIGNPFGVGQTVTHGIVSALARTQVGITDYQFFIQTDAAINPGNSGGALVDLAGKLVGINTAIFSRSGGSQGIGFAIPANMVQGGGRVGQDRRHVGEAAVARRAAAGGDAGDRRKPRPQAAVRRAGRERDAGQPGRARRACKAGDLIIAIDGQAVDDPNAFDYRFATKSLGGTAQLGYLRAGQGGDRSPSRSKPRPTRRTRNSSSVRARRSRARRSPTCRRRSPTSCGSIPRPRAW